MITFNRIIDYFVLEAKAKINESAHRSLSALTLQKSYRELKKESRQKTLTPDEQHIYGVVRLAGTLSALNAVLDQWHYRELKKPLSILDVGSGPGTALFAALMQFETVSALTAMEKNPGFIDIAQKAMKDLFPHHKEKITWHQGVIPNVKLDSKHDVAILSYVLSETKEPEVPAVVQWLIHYANDYVVIVDAGTPRGYEQMMRARYELIKHGYKIIAPCPHQLPCPLMRSDFCHFSVRFLRHEETKRVKSATAQAEDEKYCYLIAKSPHLLSSSDDSLDRIVKRPMQRSGHRVFDLCTNGGELKRKVVSKKDGQTYRLAKELDWGDLF